jgi:hypothetical protein
MIRRPAAALLLLVLAGCATASGPVESLSEFEARAELCGHWGGEEAYDAARGAQIDAALRRGRCDALMDDAAALRAAHQSDPTALARIEAALAPFV